MKQTPQRGRRSREPAARRVLGNAAIISTRWRPARPACRLFSAEGRQRHRLVVQLRTLGQMHGDLTIGIEANLHTTAGKPREAGREFLRVSFCKSAC